LKPDVEDRTAEDESSGCICSSSSSTNSLTDKSLVNIGAPPGRSSAADARSHLAERRRRDLDALRLVLLTGPKPKKLIV